METEPLVPMQWPCGPLAVERGVKRGDLTSRERECLDHWSRPAALDLLHGSPVNALLVPWADGSLGDRDHQAALAPLVEAARARRLASIGWVADGADPEPSADAAKAVGLDALATESAEVPKGLPLLRFRDRSFDGVSPGRFLGVSGNPWPGMKTEATGTYDAWTGPTGPPWIDSNAWYVRLARDLVQPQATWLLAEPEGEPTAAAYEQAVADASVYGGRWVVSLDRERRMGLSEGRAEARDTWDRIARSLAFFEEHRAWAGYHPDGPLGVVSDFAGANEFISFEAVNLLTRRNILYRVLEKVQADGSALDDLAMVLYLDEAPPGPELVRRLYAFAEQGGTLVTPPGWEARGSEEGVAPYPGFRLTRHGSGRVAVAREELLDPFFVVESVFGLTRHAHDRLRVFNPGVSQVHYSDRADGRAAVLHVLHHSRRPFETHTSVWFRRPWTSARRWEPGAGSPEAVEREAKPPGVEFHLPAVSVYCALEVSAERGDA